MGRTTRKTYRYADKKRGINRKIQLICQHCSKPFELKANNNGPIKYCPRCKILVRRIQNRKTNLRIKQGRPTKIWHWTCPCGHINRGPNTTQAQIVNCKNCKTKISIHAAKQVEAS